MRINVLLFALLLLLGGCGTPVEGGILYRTADPSVGLFVPYVEAAVAPAQPDPVAEELEETEADDQDCVLKGNIGAAGQKILHQPGGAYYSRTRIDLDKGEKWFCDIASAEAEGWRLSER